MVKEKLRYVRKFHYHLMCHLFDTCLSHETQVERYTQTSIYIHKWRQKEKFAFEQATKAQRWRKATALLFLYPRR